MQALEVRIEAVEFRGRAYWQVRLGRRALRFPHEAAARAFAAQLHTRREWLLTQQSQADGPEPSPEQ
ncbi:MULTISPECIES: hypothetical protein [Pseudomonas]|uniref:DUF45 domain-containing protein n=1 Tax=Pseudomonas nitroreducens TaxID=46680 RepID=A0ABS0KEF3_PSENT|nr:MULTISPECIES: hypothetical protein [Pseudomonas]MBG6286462.1 hypothetical protein [Pseudomonas nitroreducens]MCJ1877758.1 hypothetical protein [Pseudomonas nitroreducens]MCJ1896988.1 hypothetical protein [Pseudomonas nitroreducens]MDG9858340.1 hypothetical protein [Pseudomonas nitroreducens]MDH1073965.1 hypothetical protein [Pseudomonas nitroreducens]